MKKATYYFGFLILFIAFTACNRYEEGSNFSFLTAKARVVNTWVEVASLYTYANGTSTTNTGYTEVEVTFDKDMNYSYTGKFIGIPFSQQGTWAFNSDKTGINLTQDPAQGNDYQSWKLIKLKNKEMKIETMDSNGNTLMFEFEEK